MLKDITISAMANDAAYDRGCRYFEEGAVELLENHANVYQAKVRGNDTYSVTVELSKRGDQVDDYSCTCPAASMYLGACKHVVATLKAIQAQQGTKKGKTIQPEQVSTPAGNRLLDYFAKAAETSIKTLGEKLTISPLLRIEVGAFHSSTAIEFRLGYTKLYVLKNIAGFVESAEAKMPVAFGKSLTVDTEQMDFADSKSAALWDFIRDSYQEERTLRSNDSYSYGYYYDRRFVLSGKQLKPTPLLLKKFLRIVGDGPVDVALNDEKFSAPVISGRPHIKIIVRDNKGAGVLDMVSPGLVALGRDLSYILQGGNIYVTDEEFRRQAKPLFEAFTEAGRMQIGPKDMGRFFSQVLPIMEKVATVDIAPAFADRFEISPLEAELYIDYYRDGIEVRPSFCYDNARFNPLTEQGPPPGERTLVRDYNTENLILRYFDKYGFEKRGRRLLQPDEEKSYAFLTEALPALKDIADVLYAETFAKKPVQAMTKVTAGVSVNDDNLLEVSFGSQDFNFDELMDIIASFRLKKRYHRLKDGTFITLGEQQLGALADFVESTGLKKGAADENMTVTMPLASAMYLDTLSREEDGLRLDRSKNFKSIVRDIRHPEDVDVDVPDSLKKTLRDYQVTGFNWLSTLAKYHLGGILADDMGLGKTLQVIAFLLATKDAAKPPSLVVAPTSLMYNWLDEVAKFAPGLKAKAIAGTKPEREAGFKAVDDSYDLIVTTYNMLKRDIALYERQTFRYCFLDEAQHIKNPTTQNAKAVKRLRTGGYFALTGTPIENTLTELWSIFDFLMPGYLFSHQKFKQRFEVPIVREQDEHARKNLQRHIAPFILRRMKKDVLSELPDKVESKMVNEMTPEQAKVYAAYFVQGQKEFAAELKAHGFDGSRIKILAILTRLRQIACDPSLFLEDYTGGSGKLDMLEEVVGEAASAGHRLLIFSQFTTMLKHIAARLDGAGLNYYYLDGSTPALERLRLVKEFNSGKEPVFLISLKAGGTGLNLTGADMVIHYDPWWNPAVEDQATDRAYRLGQRNNVQVLKFITKDTIEEKIFALQEKKKSLIDQMIQPGENFLSRLTEEEISDLFRV